MHTLKILDTIFNVIFIIEAMIKIISFGFVTNGPDSYLRNNWNIMDFLIVVVSIFDLVMF